mmetsp:Transcript_9395/g.12650  ORF Transcript_9395/g.12650 Transcript_9395/m.12650 type:complete len:197 (+) Transcript_9395:44-634(+)|eukprot:CAMPEP_0201475706 /NCGR_PEP_ID=MMETSP0151_2-20130828/1077_1 /ASSEMBLY_ACC=CAM_ASM_000257 /TAXON_ID=200890 /ORGANISM="Paramoeba atlantica, Strain 621/1 / CCAP 1560/9" /LENGTH=196 /DNA_ID=CAMNT_0047855867 /DNA_START=37 /DNA_END=627 /DNA_ORIENTATION=+
MGGVSTKALWYCETIYPPDDGHSCIPPEKLQKAYDKGDIPRPPPRDEEDLDEDLDSKIDAAIKQVWSYYDKKNEGRISKSTTKKFLEHSFELLALRKHRKPKELLAPGVSMGKALDQTYAEMANGNASAPHITFDDFQNFINANDLEEALGKLTGQNGPVIINTNVQLADAEKMAAEFGGHKAVKAGEIEYREYYE